MNEIEDHHIEKINEFFNKNLTLNDCIIGDMLEIY